MRIDNAGMTRDSKKVYAKSTSREYFESICVAVILAEIGAVTRLSGALVFFPCSLILLAALIVWLLDRRRPPESFPKSGRNYSSSSALNSTRLSRKAISADWSPSGSRAKELREAAASPPCSRIASVSVVARPSCR